MSITVVTTALLLVSPSATLADAPLLQGVAEERSSSSAPLHISPDWPYQNDAGETLAVSAPVVIQAIPPTDPEAVPPDIQDDILVTGRRRSAAGDPLRAVNAQSFAATQLVDRAIVAPVALTYQRVLPAPVRGGIRNFFSNLSEPVAFLNFLLQIKPGKAAETAGRFALNTTIGVAGLIDVAKTKPFRLPRRPNGFANTLGYYGVKPGPFLFLPIIGPTTVRDLAGLGIDRMVLPTAFGQPFNQPTYTVPATIVGSLDYRAEFDTQLHKLRGAPDPYAASRANYLESRQAEIDALRGRRPSQPVLRRTFPVLP